MSSSAEGRVPSARSNLPNASSSPRTFAISTCLPAPSGLLATSGADKLFPFQRSHPSSHLPVGPSFKREIHGAFPEWGVNGKGAGEDLQQTWSFESRGCFRSRLKEVDISRFSKDLSRAAAVAYTLRQDCLDRGRAERRIVMVPCFPFVIPRAVADSTLVGGAGVKVKSPAAPACGWRCRHPGRSVACLHHSPSTLPPPPAGRSVDTLQISTWLIFDVALPETRNHHHRSG